MSSNIKTSNRLWISAVVAIVALVAIVIVSHNLQGQSASTAPTLASNQPEKDQALFNPPLLRGLVVNPDSPTDYFDFILDVGSEKASSEEELKPQAGKLINYFFLGLTLPSDQLWVNLNPNQPDRLTSPLLAATDMGEALLDVDLKLKQDAARLTDPRTALGREYWTALKQKLAQKGIHSLSSLPFSRLWIVPKDAVMEEEGQAQVNIVNAKLKVCLESEYLNQKESNFKLVSTQDPQQKLLEDCVAETMKELILPEIEYAVNHSKRYAAIRQVYYSLILAEYFKQRYKDTPSLYQPYFNSGHLKGLQSKQPWSQDKYFKAYVASYEQGEYSFVQKEYDQSQLNTVNRHYFSGGVEAGVTINPDNIIILASGSVNTGSASPADTGIVNVDFVVDETLYEPRYVRLRTADLSPFEQEAIEITAQALGGVSGSPTGKTTRRDFLKTAVAGLGGAAVAGIQAAPAALAGGRRWKDELKALYSDLFYYERNPARGEAAFKTILNLARAHPGNREINDTVRELADYHVEGTPGNMTDRAEEFLRDRDLTSEMGADSLRTDYILYGTDIIDFVAFLAEEEGRNFNGDYTWILFDMSRGTMSLPCGRYQGSYKVPEQDQERAKKALAKMGKEDYLAQHKVEINNFVDQTVEESKRLPGAISSSYIDSLYRRAKKLARRGRFAGKKARDAFKEFAKQVVRIPAEDSVNELRDIRDDYHNVQPWFNEAARLLLERISAERTRPDQLKHRVVLDASEPALKELIGGALEGREGLPKERFRNELTGLAVDKLSIKFTAFGTSPRWNSISDYRMAKVPEHVREQVRSALEQVAQDLAFSFAEGDNQALGELTELARQGYHKEGENSVAYQMLELLASGMTLINPAKKTVTPWSSAKRQMARRAMEQIKRGSSPISENKNIVSGSSAVPLPLGFKKAQEVGGVDLSKITFKVVFNE